MNEITNGLIQMNAHMEMTRTAETLIIIGVLLAVFCGMGALLADRGWKFAAILGAFAVAGAILVIFGVNQPRIKEIHACAAEPVSLEQISAKYDIVEVDGKELILRER